MTDKNSDPAIMFDAIRIGLASPEKIHEQLVRLAVLDAPAPNTIAKYLTTPRTPPTEKQRQSWITFLRNQNLWSMDCCIVPTIRFQVLYVFIVVNHARRRIEHVAVTDRVSSSWMIQQIRNATPFGKQPQYLLHDNDPVFTSGEFQRFLERVGIQSVRTTPRSPWQNAICERTIGILRQELLNHIIPLNQEHLHTIVNEYVTEYYNPHRTHQGIACQTLDISPPPPETTVTETNLIFQKVLSGLYHTYQKVA